MNYTQCLKVQLHSYTQTRKWTRTHAFITVKPNSVQQKKRCMCLLHVSGECARSRTVGLATTKRKNQCQLTLQNRCTHIYMHVQVKVRIIFTHGGQIDRQIDNQDIKAGSSSPSEAHSVTNSCYSNIQLGHKHRHTQTLTEICICV